MVGNNSNWIFINGREEEDVEIGWTNIGECSRFPWRPNNRNDGKFNKTL